MTSLFFPSFILTQRMNLYLWMHSIISEPMQQKRVFEESQASGQSRSFLSDATVQATSRQSMSGLLNRAMQTSLWSHFSQTEQVTESKRGLHSGRWKMRCFSSVGWSKFYSVTPPSAWGLQYISTETASVQMAQQNRIPEPKISHIINQLQAVCFFCLLGVPFKSLTDTLFVI